MTDEHDFEQSSYLREERAADQTQQDDVEKELWRERLAEALAELQQRMK